MFKLSEIISKPVLSVYEGVKVGYVKNICFDEKLKKVKGFFVFNDNVENCESFVLLKNVYIVGESAILLKNLSKLTTMLPEENSPINTSVYSFSGKEAGEVNDACFDDKLNTICLKTNKEMEIKIEDVVNVGYDVIFYTDNKVKICIEKMKPKNQNFENNENIKANILELGGKEQNIELKNALPVRVSSSGKFLLGRRANKSILGLNNEYIVKKGQVISEKTIQTAKQHNKLNELTHSTNN